VVVVVVAAAVPMIYTVVEREFKKGLKERRRQGRK
jgi:hypothetical protein